MLFHSQINSHILLTFTEHILFYCRQRKLSEFQVYDENAYQYACVCGSSNYQQW